MSRSRVDRLNDYGWSAVFAVCAFAVVHVLWRSVAELWARWM